MSYAMDQYFHTFERKKWIIFNVESENFEGK